MELIFNYLFTLIIVVYIMLTTFFLQKKFSRDLFHPRVVYRYLVFFIFIPNYLLFSNNVSMESESCTLVLVTALSFFIALDVVDILLSKRLALSAKPICNLNDIFYKKAFLVLFVAGWVWRSYALNNNLLYGTFLATQLEVKSYGNLVGILNGIPLLAAFGYLVFEKNKSFPVSYLPIICCEVGWALMSGSKVAILYVVLPIILIAYKRSWVRLNYRFLIISGFLLVSIVFVSFATVTTYRAGVYKSVSRGGGLGVAALSGGLTEAFSSLSDPISVNMSGGIMERLNWAESYAALIERKDLWQDLWLGNSYLPIVVWWMPRFLWPDKPIVSVGAWYGENVLGWDFKSRSEGAITIWGDALMNFGIPGALLVSLVWVGMSYTVYGILNIYGKWGLLSLSVIYIRLMLGLEQNFASPLVAIQQQLILILVIKLFFDASRAVIYRRGIV